MPENNAVIDVTLKNKSFRFKCLPEEEERLQHAALLFDQQLRKIDQQAASSVGFEYQLVLGGINLAGELVEAQKKLKKLDETIKRLAKLRDKLQKAVAIQD